MASPKKAAPKKKSAPNKRSKSRNTKPTKKGFSRSIEPINLGNAIQQPMPNAQQVFENVKEQSTTSPITSLHANNLVGDQAQTDIQSYMDYKAANPGSIQGRSFASYMAYKANGFLYPAIPINSTGTTISKVNEIENSSIRMSFANDMYLSKLDKCKQIFAEKLVDYGASWRTFRMKSLTDQIFIKAYRIRTIQEKGKQKISDTIESEYIGIANYSIVAMIQMKLMPTIEKEDNYEGIGNMYDLFIKKCFSTMQEKNHDYGEAWWYMQEESFCDMILVRLKRIQQIVGNAGNVQYSEPLDQNFIDIVNYAIFALIRYSEKSFS